MTNRRRIAQQIADAPITGDVPALTAREILSFLARLHDNRDSADRWAYIEELSNATGTRGTTRIDAWALNLIPSEGLGRIAYEVKVSRSDFLREIKQPTKRRYALLYSNKFYFAAPKGLIQASEIPPECGLVEFGRDGDPYYRVAAPERDCMPPPWLFMAAVARAIRNGARRDALSHLAYEHEALTARQRVFAGMVDGHKERERRDKIAAQMVRDQIWEARRELDEQCDRLGRSRYNWRAIDRNVLEEATNAT